MVERKPDPHDEELLKLRERNRLKRLRQGRPYEPLERARPLSPEDVLKDMETHKSTKTPGFPDGSDKMPLTKVAIELYRKKKAKERERREKKSLDKEV